MMVGGRNNRKGLESQDVCCRRDAADGRLQKINIAARLGDASEMPCRLLGPERTSVRRLLLLTPKKLYAVMLLTQFLS
jgi:hypothetical protein